MRRAALAATVAALVAALIALGATQLVLAVADDELPPVAVRPPAGVARGELPADLACARLQSQLPDEIAGQPQRLIEPPDATAAAWGDPPAVLRCGVGTPRGFDPGTVTGLDVVEIGGVSFFLEERTRTATVVDRGVFIEVRTPEGVQVAEVLGPVAQAVDESLPFDDGRD